MTNDARHPSHAGAPAPEPAWRRKLPPVLALALAALACSLALAGCAPGSQSASPAITPTSQGAAIAGSMASASSTSGDAFLAALPAPSAEDEASGFVTLNGNEPSFSPQDATTEAFQTYAPLDSLGRCGTAYACLGPETLPTQERGDIHEVHPSGWVQASYDFIDGESLYNRSHLIAFSLSGQNANERNLITGTRHMNADVMRPVEEMVADYIRQTRNHVLYRVTPVFAGKELVARGVQMEARSMEDGGQGVEFNVYLFNTQPGVEIDYATGRSHASTGGATQAGERDWVLNTRSRRFHDPSCPDAGAISPGNREDVHAGASELEAQGYAPHAECVG